MNKDIRLKEKQRNDTEVDVDFSRRLCNILDQRGLSEKNKKRQSEILLAEAIRNSSWRDSFEVIGGGNGEGSELIGSDLDLMVLEQNVIVVSSTDEAKLFPKHFTILLMCPENHRPCYPALKFLTSINVENFTIFNKGLLNEKTIAEKIDGINFLSSRNYNDKGFLHVSLFDVDGSFTQLGPCSSFSMGYGNNRVLQIVFAIPASKWPNQALHWISRRRKFGWPNKDLIQKVVDTRCTLVPIGNPASASQHIEWRLSFLAGERLLIWSFNKIQFYCFMLAKIILKIFIASKFPDTIDSFILKTTVFWMIEETPLEFWSKENIFRCIKAILSRLKDYIKQESLSHYFVPANNILISKILLKEQCQAVVNELEIINENLFYCLQRTFESSYVCPRCSSHTRCLINEKRQQDCLVARRYIQTFICGLEKNEFVERLLSEKPESVYTEHVDILKKILHIQKSCDLYKLSYEKGDKKISLESVEKSFIKGIDEDAVDGWLFLATFYYMQGKVAKANNLIELLLKCQKLLHNHDALKQREVNPVTTKKDDKIWEMFSLTLNKSWYICLPSPVACECLMVDDSLIDIPAVVYTYFLKVMVQLKQKHLKILPEILFQFEKIVNICFDVIDVLGRDIVLNLLGFCLLEAAFYEKAILYFYKSYKERTVTKNPCFYYAVLTIYKYKRAKKRKMVDEDDTI